MSRESVLNYFEQAGADRDNKLVLGGSFESAGGSNLRTITLAGYLSNVSSSGQIYVPVPVAGTLLRVDTAINGAISGSDVTLTVKTGAGTAGTITIAQSGSAAGDVDTLEVASNGAVTAGSTVEIETDGASTGVVAVAITLTIQVD